MKAVCDLIVQIKGTFHKSGHTYIIVLGIDLQGD